MSDTTKPATHPLPTFQTRSCPVRITEVARAEVQEILLRKNIPTNYHLRLGVRAGAGCAGTNYILGFDQPSATDDAYQQDGLIILIEKKHIMYLIGLQLDFINTEAERGFVFGPKPTIT
jgi:iron-sulfur cluster assembly protein